jgi:galactonate dehydratase
MKISMIRTWKVFANWRNWVFVKVETDEGVHGVGEATLEGRALAVEAGIQELSRNLVGRDPSDIEDMWQAAYYRETFWVGGPIMLTAISAIEMALWDIVGKTLGVPVYKLLGGKCRSELRLYANGWYFGAVTPDDFAQKAAETVKRGYTALKWDPFGSADKTLTLDQMRQAVANVAAVREAVGNNVDLLIEAHGRFNTYTAITVANRLEEYNPMFLEEPVPPENYDALAEVKRATRVPIATGERCYTTFGYRDLLSKSAAHIIQPDVMHAGGILETKKIAAMAGAHYIPVAPHNPNGPIAMAATMQLAAGIPNFLILEYLVDDVPWRDTVVSAPAKVENGYVKLSEAPGLGVDLVEPECEAHPYVPVDLSLFSDAAEKNIMKRAQVAGHTKK